jgi:hypothetical protein
LRDKNQVAGLPARPKLVGDRPLEAESPRLAGTGFEREGEHRAIAGLDAVATALAQGFDLGQGKQLLGELGRQITTAVGSAAGFGRDVDVARQRIGKPVGDAGAEAADHDADAQGGGDRDGECCDGQS